MLSLLTSLTRWHNWKGHHHVHFVRNEQSIFSVTESCFKWIKKYVGVWYFPTWSLFQGVLTVRSNRGNFEWGEENWEWGGGGGGELQNEAREEEKCFIIHSDPSYLSAVTKGIRGAHQHSALITKNIQVYIQCTVCQWQGLYSSDSQPFFFLTPNVRWAWLPASTQRITFNWIDYKVDVH